MDAKTYLLTKLAQLLPGLFYPIRLAYSYQQPPQVVKEKIATILKGSGKLWSGPDINGHFISGDRFTIIAASGAYTQGVKYASTLYGQVMDTEGASTRVEVEICASSAYKTVCYFSITFGCVPLLMAVATLSLALLLGAAAMLLLGPGICNWLAGIANETVKDRHLRYIDRELRSAVTHKATKR